MAVTTTKTNKPLNPRGNDQSPKGYNRAELYTGKALDFDGVNDYVNLDGFTMTGNVATIVFQAKFSNGNYMLDINTQRFVVLNDTTNGLSIYNSNAWAYYGNTDRAKIGFYTIVSDGTTQRAYYNGQQLGEDKTIVAIDWDSITEMALGSNNNGTGNFFDGQIAGFKSFNTALTAAQVADLYNNPEKIVPTGVADSALKLWLPMMEGAGTTAYDGSGNGNHGTISGATWTHGVGAPVAQTAVIDWNKGTNRISNHDWDSGQVSNNSSISTSSHSAPDGVETAYIFDDGTANTYHRSYKQASCSAGEVTASVFVKKKDVDYINVVLGVDGGGSKDFALVDLVNGTINDTSGNPTATSIQSVGDGWYYVSVQETHASGNAIIYIYGQDPTNGSSIDDSYTGANNQTYIWGASVKEGAINNVFIPTYGSVQTSPVLLPQGLTTGRDITGVNLFENVRKQGALNLDGNSWAEVHDNESLDFGTGSFSLEVWSKAKYINTGSSYNVLLTLGDNVSTGSTSSLYIDSSLNYTFRYDSTLIVASGSSEGDWSHVVGVYDGGNINIYLNGVFVTQTAASATSKTNTFAKVIGSDDTAASRTYKDQIAQPRIYNRALTAEEVERNYNAGALNLELRWP